VANWTHPFLPKENNEKQLEWRPVLRKTYKCKLQVNISSLQYGNESKQEDNKTCKEYSFSVQVYNYKVPRFHQIGPCSLFGGICCVESKCKQEFGASEMALDESDNTGENIRAT
jgi:hypothetical protein